MAESVVIGGLNLFDSYGAIVRRGVEGWRGLTRWDWPSVKVPGKIGSLQAAQRPTVAPRTLRIPLRVIGSSVADLRATAVQTSAMISWLSTIAEHTRVTNEILRSMASMHPLDMRSVAQVGGDVGSLVQVQVSAPITVHGAYDPQETARAVVGLLTSRIVDQALGEAVTRLETAQGKPSTVTK